jgi:D-alanyl-D-alanine carboxypeptidase
MSIKHGVARRYVTGCISRDSAPYIQVVAAIKSDDFAASLFRAALYQAGVFISSTTTAACASTTWSWNMKHTSLPLSSLMNHTLQDRCMLFVVPSACFVDFDSPFSDNLYAETWLQALAAQSALSTPASGSSQYPAIPTRNAALLTLRTLLTQMGVDGGLFEQKDGRLCPTLGPLTLCVLHLQPVALLFYCYQHFLQRLVALEPCVSCCHRR